MKTRIYSRQVAKAPSSESLFLPLRLCVFARDIPTFGCGSAALGAHHDWVYFHVGEMVSVGGENIGQAHHRLHQRIDVARALTAHAFEYFVAAQLFEHLACFSLVDRQ